MHTYVQNDLLNAAVMAVRPTLVYYSHSATLQLSRHSVSFIIVIKIANSWNSWTEEVALEALKFVRFVAGLFFALV